MQRYRLSIVAIVGLLALLLIGALSGLGGSSSRAEEGQSALQMPEFPPTPTIPPVQPPRELAGSGPILFADSFANDASLASWQIVDVQPVLPGEESVWRISDGRLIQDRTANAYNPDFRDTMAVTGSASWTNYVVSANLYDSASATMGLVARRQGNSFYRFRMFSNGTEGNRKLVLERVIDGVATELASSPTPGYEHRRWYTVALSVAGSQIAVTIDGATVLQATDTTLVNGQAGVTTIAFGAVSFDNVTVTAK